MLVRPADALNKESLAVGNLIQSDRIEENILIVQSCMQIVTHYGPGVGICDGVAERLAAEHLNMAVRQYSCMPCPSRVLEKFIGLVANIAIPIEEREPGRHYDVETP